MLKFYWSLIWILPLPQVFSLSLSCEREIAYWKERTGHWSTPSIGPGRAVSQRHSLNENSLNTSSRFPPNPRPSHFQYLSTPVWGSPEAPNHDIHCCSPLSEMYRPWETTGRQQQPPQSSSVQAASGGYPAYHGQSLNFCLKRQTYSLWKYIKKLYE